MGVSLNSSPTHQPAFHQEYNWKYRNRTSVKNIANGITDPSIEHHNFIEYFNSIKNFGSNFSLIASHNLANICKNVNFSNQPQNAAQETDVYT